MLSVSKILHSLENRVGLAGNSSSRQIDFRPQHRILSSKVPTKGVRSLALKRGPFHVFDRAGLKGFGKGFLIGTATLVGGHAVALGTVVMPLVMAAQSGYNSFATRQAAKGQTVRPMILGGTKFLASFLFHQLTGAFLQPIHFGLQSRRDAMGAEFFGPDWRKVKQS